TMRCLTPAERATRNSRYREAAAKWRAEAAKLRARAAESRASLQKLSRPQTAEERAAIEAPMAEAQREALLEIRRHTRHGKPDARFTRDGVSKVQKITGKEKVWRLYVRPGVSTSTTFGKAN